MPKPSAQFNKLTLHARKSLSHAERIARLHHAKEVRPEHLLYGVFVERGSVGSTILTNIGLTQDILHTHFGDAISEHAETLHSALPSSTHVKKIITTAHAIAAEFGYTYVGTEHIVYALLNTKDATLKKILTSTKPSSRTAQPLSAPNPSNLFGIENLAALFGSEREEQNTSAIDQFCTTIAELPHEPFIGRHSDIDRIVTILGRRTKNNPIIIGEPGTGKTAIVEHLAHYAASSDAPHHLYGKNIVTLDMALLVAGTSFRGEFEQRLKNIIAEAQEDPNIILFIDEIHTIIGTGNTGGSLDAANILKPALARGSVRIIGATTFTEYKKHIEKDAALERRFQKIILAEPSADDARAILTGVKKIYEHHHAVTITKDVIAATVRLADRYLPEQFFPDKALDLIDETSARLSAHAQNSTARERVITLEHALRTVRERKTDLVRTEQYDAAAQARADEKEILTELHSARIAQEKDRKTHRPVVRIEDIAATVSATTGIPVSHLLSTPDTTILAARDVLARTIIGQDRAIHAISDTLIRAASGLTSTNRPLGSFLFLGPTGTGKTFTAQTLARELYKQSTALIRVDMSEFMERHQTAKLIGAPAGYVGYGEGGTLTEKVRRNPHSVILFDEMEKEHPDVAHLLLQILEDGVLTDAAGRVVNFTNTIIILTSNVGAGQLVNTKSVGFTKSAHSTFSEAAIRTLAKETFAPELLARLDQSIVFTPLSEKDLYTIAKSALDAIKKRLMEKSAITLTYRVKVPRLLAKRAAASGDGARAIRHIIQNEIEGHIARHALKNGPSTKMIIDVAHDDSITIT